MFKTEVCCFVYKFLHNKLPYCFEGSFRLNYSVHCRSLRRADAFVPVCLKNQFAVNLFCLLGLDIGVKFNQISKTAETEVASKSVCSQTVLFHHVTMRCLLYHRATLRFQQLRM